MTTECLLLYVNYAIIEKETVLRKLRIMGGFLTDAPFGVPEMINNAKDASTSYFLVEKAGAKLLVAVTDEFMETRQLSCDTSGKRFDLGEYRFAKTVKL